MDRPSNLQNAPTVRIAATPLSGETARFVRDAHSPINAVSGGISFLEFAHKASGLAEFPFPRTRRRLEELLAALKAGRDEFVATLDGADPEVLVRLEADAIRAALDARPAAAKWVADFRGLVLAAVRARAQELLERWENKDGVGTFSQEDIGEMLGGILLAIAEKSRGTDAPFGIAFRRADQGPDDYLLTLGLRGPDGQADVTMPEILRDVIRDLVCNARKYSPRGSEITVSVVESQDLLTITVEDQGMGVRPEDLPRLGELGFRSEEAQKMASGHGMGLPKANDVATQWGGSLGCKTVSGVGTIFRVVIPKPYAARREAGDALEPKGR